MLSGLEHANSLRRLRLGRCRSLRSLVWGGKHRSLVLPALRFVDLDQCENLPDEVRDGSRHTSPGHSHIPSVDGCELCFWMRAE